MLTADEVSDFFDRYNDAFGACARGDRPVEDVLAFYGPAMLITVGELVVGPGAGAAAEWVRGQVAAMQADGYDHTDIVGRRIQVINAGTALFTGDFSRRRRDGSEVNAFTVTYLAYRANDVLRIAALAMHA